MTDYQKEQQKPELLFADLHMGRKFDPLTYPITEELIETYMDTVGDRHPLYQGDAGVDEGPDVALAPPGLAAIYARLSYLQDYSMPSGGILTKQEFDFTGPMRIGDILNVRAEVTESFVDEKKRNRVAFLIEAKNQNAEPISTIRLHTIWPK